MRSEAQAWPALVHARVVQYSLGPVQQAYLSEPGYWGACQTWQPCLVLAFWIQACSLPSAKAVLLCARLRPAAIPSEEAHPMLYSKQTYGPSLTEHEPPKIVNRLRRDAGQLGEGITNGGLAHPPRRAPARQARARLIIHRATWTDPCERRLGPLAHNWHEGPAASHVAQKTHTQRRVWLTFASVWLGWWARNSVLLALSWGYILPQSS